MTSVTFPTNLGGDGSTVTDDSNATTGLGNGGHRYRFLPTLINTVAMAQTAFNAANTAVTSPASLTATSVTSLTIGAGSKSLTLTQTGKGFNVGGYVLIAATAAPSAYMYGLITAFTPATGAMTVNVLSVNSSGTLTAWTISAAQPNLSLYSPLTGALSIYFDGVNMAIGGSTSAWGTGAKALDFGNNGSVANLSSGDFHLSQNTYYNGTNWIAKATGTGALYKQSAGTHTWYGAASVSAGGVQTWTQQWQLDASGNGTLAGILTVGSNLSVGGSVSVTGRINGDGAEKAGMVSWFATSTPPTGFIAANGAAVSRTTYAALFAAIGTTFGVGDGSTTFNVPDLRDRMAISSGLTYALAATGGSKDATLVSHNHTGTTDAGGSASGSISGGNGTGDFGTFNAATGVFSLSGAAPNRPQGSAGGGSYVTETLTIPTHTHTFTTATVGSSATNANLPPYIGLLACIKY